MLSGERVLLRAIEATDYPAITKFLNDLAVHVLADDEAPVPKSEAQVRAEFDELLKKPGELVCFAIEADAKLVGTCSVHQFDLTARRRAIGISINDPEYWGKGFGSEAVELMLDFAFRHRNFHRVWLTVRSDNTRAVRAYEKCGFVTEGVFREHIWSDGLPRLDLHGDPGPRVGSAVGYLTRGRRLALPMEGVRVDRLLRPSGDFLDVS